MNLDTPTLLVVTCILCAGMSLALILVWRFVLRERALLLWGIAQGCFALGMMLMAQRGSLPDFLTIIVANSFNLACYALIWWAACDYRRVPPPAKTLAAAFAVLLASYVYFTYVELNIMVRIAVMHTLIPALMAGAATTLMRRRDGRIVGAQVMAGLTFLLDAAFRLMVLVLVFTNASAANPLQTNQVIAITILSTTISFIAWGLAVIMMVLDGVARQLADSRNLLQSVLDAIPVRVYWKDRDSRYLGCNRHFAADAGLASSEAIAGKTDDDLAWRNQAEIHRVDDRQVIASGNPKLYYEEGVAFADGRLARISTSKVPLRGAHNDVIGLVGAYEDITERKENAEALRRLNASLSEQVAAGVSKNMAQERLLIQQARLAAMGEMIGNIAHQWRQPINALTLILANIKDAYEFNDLSEEFLNEEVNNGQQLIQRMSCTIDDFRNFFKPNKEKQNFRVFAAVEDAINLVSTGFQNNEIKIDVVASDRESIAYGYPNEFAQVVLNALSNAKDAITGKTGASPGTATTGKIRRIAGKVAVRVENSSDAVSVSIRDNGGGIPEEVLGKVFDPYFTTKEKGTGIGLYMSKTIMDNMGGDIAVHNSGDGVEVQLTLQLANDAQRMA